MRLGMALLMVAGLALPAAAKDVTIGAASLTLPPPAGHCELDPAQPSDGRMLQAVERALEGNRLLSVTADCRQLADWRAGKRQLLDSFAQYQTLANAADGPSAGSTDETLKQICSSLRTQGEKAVSDLAGDMRTRIERGLKDVKLNQVRFLGVVAEEPNACYAVQVQRFKAENGRDVTLVSLYALSFVRGKIVYYYLFAPYQNNFTVTSLLAKHKANLAALHAANPN